MCDCASRFFLSRCNLAGYLRSWQTCASRLLRPTSGSKWLKESFSVISHDFIISHHFTKSQLSVPHWSFQDQMLQHQAADRDAESRMLFGGKLKAQQDAMDEAQNHPCNWDTTQRFAAEKCTDWRIIEYHRESYLPCSKQN